MTQSLNKFIRFVRVAYPPPSELPSFGSFLETLVLTVRFKQLGRFAAMMLGATLCACGRWEHASVFVAYDTKPQSETWRFPKSGRHEVEEAFKAFSEENGYKCRPSIKHAEELTCRGPNDLYLAFQPVLNKPEFIATFSWVDSSERTHNEFVRLVSEFRKQMSTVVGESNVQRASST